MKHPTSIAIFEYVGSLYLLFNIVGLLQTVLSAAEYGCPGSCVSIVNVSLRIELAIL